MTNKKLSPLIGEIIHQTAKTIVCQRYFSLENDLYFDHHRFGGVPFLPGVIGLEIFSEIVNYKHPNKTIQSFENVEFCAALRLKNDEPKIGRITIEFDENKAEAILCLLDEDTKDLVCDSKLCFKATINFAEKRNLRDQQPTLLKMPLLPREFIYQILPHGKLFHVLTEINQITDTVIAKGYFKKRKLFSWKHTEFLTSPLAVEAGFQAIGLFDFIKNERVGLPSKIKKLEFFSCKRRPYFIIGKKSDDKTFEFRILSKKGDVLLEAKGYETVDIDMGETRSVLEKIKSHSLRQSVKTPKFSWIEVVSKNLIQNKLSREPDYINEFLTSEELELVNNLTDEQKANKIIKLYTLKRALRIVTFSKDLKQYPLLFDDNNEPFSKRKKRQIYLSFKESNDYAFAIASYKNKYDLLLLTDKLGYVQKISVKKRKKK